MDNFKSTEKYIATSELRTAVNAAIALEKPLLIKGEPGTGKTLLAYEIAKSLNKELLTWHIKSTTTANQGLYEYDAVSRLRDSQLGNEKVYNIENYIKKGKLWQAFETEESVVLLIDEIDKADIEFPNDLLQEIDKMEFYCYELQKTVTAKKRPIIIITSNNEKELPDAFLRRCFFHFIKFPDRATLNEIVKVHFTDIDEVLLKDALTLFYKIRSVQQIKKKPSTSELIDWIKLLIYDKASADFLKKNPNSTPPYIGALIKNEQDEQLIENYAQQIFK